MNTPSFFRARPSRPRRRVALFRGGLLLSGLLFSARPLSAQALGSQVLDESGSQAASGGTQLVFSQGQSVSGSGVSGTMDLEVGFIPTLGIDVLPPSPGNPPFSMVGVSSLTANWLANGNSTATVYNAHIPWRIFLDRLWSGAVFHSDQAGVRLEEMIALAHQSGALTRRL